MPPFSQRATMAALMPGEPLIKLQFLQAQNNGNRFTMFAHMGVISSSSRALKDKLTHGRAQAQAAADAGAAEVQPLVLSLEEPYSAVWEQLMQLLYTHTRLNFPMLRFAAMKYEALEQLLLLADKYDMPRIKAMVDSHLPADSSSLKMWLMRDRDMGPAAGAAAHGSSLAPEAERALKRKMYQWAALCSKVGLEAQVQLCFEEIIKNLDLQDSEVHALLPKLKESDAANLREAMQGQLNVARQAKRKIDELESQLDDLRRKAARPVEDRVRLCATCRKPWFYKPDSRDLVHYCLYCGSRDVQN